MSKMGYTKLKIAIFILIPILFAFAYLQPFLKYPAFNVIDDGASIWLSEKILTTVSEQKINQIVPMLVEQSEGRLRPIYHLYTVGIYAFFGANPLAFWVMQATMLGTSMLLMGIFLYLTTKKYLLSLLLPLTALLFVPTADNFFRLGTAEPKQTLVWLLFLIFCYFLKNTNFTLKKMLLGVFLLWICFFTKETSITFVPFFFSFWLWKIFILKDKSSETVAYGLAIIISSLVFLLLLPARTGYGSAFEFHIHDMWLRFVSTLGGTPILYLSFILVWTCGIIRYSFHRLVFQKSLKTQENDVVWQILLGVQALSLLIIGILPWQWPLSRYFFQLYIIAILSVGLELKAWTSFIPFLKEIGWKWKFVILSALFFIFSLPQVLIISKKATVSLLFQDMKTKLLILRLDIAEIWLLVFFILLLVGIRLYKMKREKTKNLIRNFHWQISLLLFICISSIISSIIWKEVYIHNFFTIEILVVLLVYIELHSWKKWIAEKQKPLAFLLSSTFLALFITVVARQTIFQGVGNFKRLIDTSFFQPAINSAQISFDTYQISYGLIDFLLTQVTQDTHIYVFENEYEILFEIGLYASHFGKQNIQVFTHSQQLVSETKTRQDFFKFEPDPVKAFLDDTQSNKILLTRPLWWSQLSNTYNLEGMKIVHLPPQYSYNTHPENVYWLVAY